MIAIVDCGMGNVGAIHNMFRRIGVESAVTDSVESIRAADQLVLPGVGAFDAGIQRLNSSGMRDVLDEKVLLGRTPVLGICLGMQLPGTHSEKGYLPGLGWLDAASRAERYCPSALNDTTQLISFYIAHGNITDHPPRPKTSLPQRHN